MRNFIECNTIAILSIPVLLGFGPPAFAQTAAPAPEPAGKVEFAQTHVLQRTGGTLNAPVQIPDRQTLLLFTPTSAIPEDYTAYLDITLNGESVQSIPSPSLTACREISKTNFPMSNCRDIAQLRGVR